MPNKGCKTQLLRLEQHQQQLEEIEQRREQHSRIAERQLQQTKVEKKEEKNRKEEGIEQENQKKKEKELEEQRRDLLHLQIQQQQEELKQRQQIMQWQLELEQQQQQGRHPNGHQKNLPTVSMSPSGLCTIYEALETSDAEEDFEEKNEEQEIVLKVKVEHECSFEERNSNTEVGSSSGNLDFSQSQSTPQSLNPAKDHKGLTLSVAFECPLLSGSTSPNQPSPIEFDWSKKADIVQQLISQTLLLNGDNCSPLLLFPGGAAGTLSPLEASLWPNLPPLTPPSATVTSVSSFSAEVSGSSPQGEWTVVELETHH
ncbi:transcription factor SPT20 homolog [Clarias gariepinus]|uniref:transcription factor SPT20 homolog n=1 Tax=Clarias gariepinus TaxID=13013 RepID=UPI00234CDF2D|nr:transcription factor SPT20 homolog [Clarias gariepinus]